MENNFSDFKNIFDLYINFFLDESNQTILSDKNILSVYFLRDLINSYKQNINYDKDLSIFKMNSHIFISYPCDDYLLTIIHNLVITYFNKKFIFNYEIMADFKDNTFQNIEKINKFIGECDIYDPFNTIEFLGERGLLTLLGIRETPGSINFLPPKKDLLILKFNELHTKNTNKNPSNLTVGARALSKHTHRSSEAFWPESFGKEIEKNKNAEIILKKIMDECVWINIHGLPGDIPIIEIRIREGYGMRWQLDGKFRGFLEPQMIDGHDKRWKH
jgi:hypothetical protein